MINDLSWVDLSTVTAQEAKQQFVDYEKTVLSPGYGDPLFKHNGQYIKESGEYTIPIDQVKPSIVKKYNLLDWQFQIKKGANNIDIALVIPLKNFNEKYIVQDMEHNGYFISLREEKRLHGYIYVIYQFEPIHQTSIKNDIKSMGCIIHISPKYNYESIKKYGFIPQHKNKQYNFPDRIFFIKGTVSIFDIHELGEMLYNVDRQYNKNNNGIYIIYWLDTELIPDSVDFFYDSNYEYGVFTYDNVPYSSVISTQEIKLKK